MGNKLDKRTNCEYCDKVLEAKYRSKRFCDAKCRIYWNRENPKPLISDKEVKKVVSDLTKNIKILPPHELKSEIANEPKENSMAFYLKYDCYTWEELKAKKEKTVEGDPFISNQFIDD